MPEEQDGVEQSHIALILLITCSPYIASNVLVGKSYNS